MARWEGCRRTHAGRVAAHQRGRRWSGWERGKCAGRLLRREARGAAYSPGGALGRRPSRERRRGRRHRCSGGVEVAGGRDRGARCAPPRAPPCSSPVSRLHSAPCTAPTPPVEPPPPRLPSCSSPASHPVRRPVCRPCYSRRAAPPPSRRIESPRIKPPFLPWSAPPPTSPPPNPAAAASPPPESTAPAATSLGSIVPVHNPRSALLRTAARAGLDLIRASGGCPRCP